MESETLELDFCKKKKKKKINLRNELIESNEVNEIYENLLQKLYDQINNKRKVSTIKILLPQTLIIGTKKTVIENFKELCDSMKRTQEHVKTFIENELCVKTSINQYKQLTIFGKFYQRNILSIMRKYINNYVKCKSCLSLNTNFEKDKTHQMMEMICSNCGASLYIEKI
jgi:translation initiation factor 2 subunit 2